METVIELCSLDQVNEKNNAEAPRRGGDKRITQRREGAEGKRINAKTQRRGGDKGLNAKVQRRGGEGKKNNAETPRRGGEKD